IKLDLKGVTSNLTELEQSQINVNKAYEEFRTSIINGSGPITNVFTSINNSISNILELLRKFNLSDEDLFGEEGAKSAREEYAKNIEFIKSYRSELRKSGQTEEEFTKLVLEYEIKKNNEYINELQNKKELQKSDFKLLGYAKEENKLLENSLKGITDKDQLLAASKAKELEDAKKLAAEKEKIRQDELKAEREAAAEKIRLSDEVFQKIVEDNDNQKVLNYLEAEEEKLYQEQSKELRKEGYDIEKEFRERERKDIEEQTQFNLDQQDLILEKKKEAKDLSIDILNQLGDFSNELANRQIQDVEDRVKKGVITEEKGAKEIAKLKRKQAITDKALGIFNAFISTSEAVANALKIKLPPPIPLIFAGLYGTLGAAQIATIAARPIPKFKTGTRSPLLEPTLAYVGDGGRSEVVRTKEGKEWFTPATSTLAVLPRGSEVLPDAEKYKREKQSVIVNNISTKDDKPNINTLLTSSGLHRWYSDSKGSKQFNDTYFRR
ncbi:MAG: hypothetical protein OEL54_04495, partial [Flavobacteriaceae bacterium]|nr:hypothetical protein [Flavobacteriaceae bacterium]